MRITLLVLLFLLVLQRLDAQTYSIIDNRAIKLHEQGDELVKSRNYDEAIEKYKLSIQREANFLESYIKWGRLLLTKGNHEEALAVVNRGESRAGKASTKIKADFSWLKLNIYLGQGAFEKAIDEFDTSSELLDEAFKRSHEYNQIKSQIEFVAKNIENKLLIHKQKLPDPINDFTLQYFPVLTADSKKLLFTKRDGTENYHTEDIFVSYYDKEIGWTKPSGISDSINTYYNEGTCTISADGNILIYTSCDAPDSFGSCDLYVAYKVNGQWQKSKNMGKNVNSRSWDSQPSLSADGRILFFSSNRRGGYGGNDIWYSLWLPDGSWSEAKNLGSVINTAKDEVSPFIYFNNEILFFASNGHQGFGGMDLFVSRVVKGEFTKPENLGYPINDHKDQFSLFITAQRDYAYYTESNYNQGKVERSFLYRFKFPEEIALGEKLVVSQGKVLNSKTGQPIDAKLSLVSLANDSTMYQFRSDGKTGEFLMIYPDRSFSGLYVEKKGYLPKIFNVERDNLKNKENLEISLTPIASGEEFIFENIFFDFDKDELKPESKSSLLRLLEFLKENPSVKIHIIGHTDNVGTVSYNHSLSQRRAESVRNFLLSKGIHESRLTAEGKGDAHPIRPNDSPENRALNRRITISIL
ncbi:OmpA family protein [Cecembia rubra]|uniref:Outer membrane protein OmpA-like peptidoglycan-associated protein n=1 Tax=Cecembia rubra TaxID=1485585 RepID=A0A2P8DWZ8_9BACT|nr:OmpA family protein [Cecembia rubra]PSL01741.1 outer membrane protein OmpA-like peptidoglycan-associated protein [Cecembia rubra]